MSQEINDLVKRALVEKPRSWFVTGGAGFIGSHVVDLLVSAGQTVTVYDNLSLSTDQYIAGYAREGKIKFIQKDLLELDPLAEAMKGHDIVFHLAANTDIPSGFKKHRIDLDNDVIATCNVLEAMQLNGIRDMPLLVDGRRLRRVDQGDLQRDIGAADPFSLYGAGKIASEAFISAYCNLFGIRAWMYRFGNVIGERTNHGVIYDFIAKLKQNPKSLEIWAPAGVRRTTSWSKSASTGCSTSTRSSRWPFPGAREPGHRLDDQGHGHQQDHHRRDGAERRRIHIHRHAARMAGRSTGGSPRYRQDPRVRLVLAPQPRPKLFVPRPVDCSEAIASGSPSKRSLA